LGEALHICERFARIALEGVNVALHQNDSDMVTLRLAQLSGESPDVRLIAEFAISALLLHLFRRFVGSSAQPRHVFFAHAAPVHRAEYTRIFAGRERFSHAFTGIEFERSWLAQKQLNHSPELCALLQTRAERLLAQLSTICLRPSGQGVGSPRTICGRGRRWTRRRVTLV
jgi:hypothetical protein